MPGDLPDYEPLMQEAVAAFWGIRDRQATEQALRGVADAGTRGSVTGGQHLGPIEALIRRVLIDAGVNEAAIHNGRSAKLPGWFREFKDWDLVVLEGNTLIAVIELKSQVGSFGNNLNNRIEEAIGQTVDFWKAVDNGLVPGLRPWFGYLMVVEESERSTRSVRTGRGLLPADSMFEGASYMQRYAAAFTRLHQERMLDAVTFAMSPRDSAQVSYPSSALSFQHFATTLHNRVREIRSLD
ncbi:MAG: PaeR7I family type II restriction endonuclease [Nitriliruptoraceae bacterium]